MNGVIQNTAEIALGTWFSVGTELHSTLHRDPVFKGLTEDQLLTLIAAHDEFKMRVSEILRYAQRQKSSTG